MEKNDIQHFLFLVENESWYACDLGEREMGLKGLRGPKKGLVSTAFKNGGRCWMMKFKLYVVCLQFLHI